LSEAKSPAVSGGNPETEIGFQLPEAGQVVVKIFNTVGEEIRTLTISKRKRHQPRQWPSVEYYRSTFKPEGKK
jgi:hypothetical protein